MSFRSSGRSRCLCSLPGYVRERLNQDLQTGDRLDDLYFTSDFLPGLSAPGPKQAGLCLYPLPGDRGASGSAKTAGQKISWTF